MSRMLCQIAVVTAIVVIVGPALAQDKNPEEIGRRTAPPAFQDLPGFDFCSEPGAPIPDQGAFNDAIFIEDNAFLEHPLELAIQIEHTWVGDISLALAYVPLGGDVVTDYFLIDRPGFPVSSFGCSGDDIDAILSDGGVVSVEDVCEPTVPTIGGVVAPFPDPMSTFDFADAEGTWLLTVSDNAAGDTGTLVRWCLGITMGPPGPGGPGTPATSTWGVVVMVVLFLATSALILRRRARV